jgi:hypothetical protein
MGIDAPKAGGSVPIILKIPIAELATGTYVLEVQASDPDAKAVKRTSDFEIE